MKYLLTRKQEVVFQDNIVDFILASMAMLILWLVGAFTAGLTGTTWIFVTTIVLMVVWAVYTSFLGVAFYQFMIRPHWGD